MTKHVGRGVVVGLFLVGLATFTRAGQDEKPKTPPAKPRHAGLERFKKLAGDWVERKPDGKLGEQVVLSYKVTAAGSAVMETVFPGQPAEMVTLYHADGADLVLTHYCAAGNQPRMRCAGGGDGKVFVFEFDGGTNLKADTDMHMHNAKITLDGEDGIESEWTHYNAGKNVGAIKFTLARKKK